MTDPEEAQAAVLIGALGDQLREMAAKLERAEHGGTCHTSRLDAMRHDIGQARFLIARLHHRYPALDTDPTPPVDGAATDTAAAAAG